MRDVVVDPDGEASARLCVLQLRECRRGHRGRELLRGEAVAAADHVRLAPLLVERRDDVEVERLAAGRRILAPVEDGDCVRRLRQHGDEISG